jgi:hypothetical protein
VTEDERRNRNPAVEKVRDLVENHPVVTAAELELHHVFLLESKGWVLESKRWVVTLNYMGTRHLIHPVTFDTVAAHHFHGPRANLDVFLTAKPNGKFEDAVGTEITVRRWTGADQ